MFFAMNRRVNIMVTHTLKDRGRGNDIDSKNIKHIPAALRPEQSQHALLRQPRDTTPHWYVQNVVV